MKGARKEQERQRRRELLLEAASRVFSRKPFDEASMQEVATEAEIGMQGLYEHFSSKQVLYEAVMLHRAKGFHERADHVLTLPGTPLERLRRLALVYVGQFKDSPMVLPMFIRDRSLFDWGLDSRFAPSLREVYAEERRRLRTILEDAVAAGDIRAMDPEFLTQLAMDVIQASLHHMHRTGEDVEACVDRALHCLFHGVGGTR